MADLQALLFDVDGTLADTERDGHRVAFNRAFTAAGLPWDWDPALYGKLLAVTGGKERIRYYIERFLEDFTPPDDLPGFIADLHRSKTAFYVELMEQGGIPLRTGVQRLLEEAAEAGLRLAIATTTTVDNVTALLRNGIGPGAESIFEVIAAGDVVPEKKPAPDIYVWAMERLQLKPDQCLALEDSRNGLLSAQGSGIRSVVITVNGYTQDDDFSGASLVVDQLGSKDSPSSILGGGELTHSLVDIALLRRVHEQAWC